MSELRITRFDQEQLKYYKKAGNPSAFHSFGIYGDLHMIPGDLTVSEKSSLLKGQRLTLCGGGGIAAIELPKLARELRRHGAIVRFVVTENCLRFIGKESLEWASAAPVVVLPTGSAEHIATDDAVVVFPATADLLAKMALGLCTDGVSTLVQSALGAGIPVLVCPTMHQSLADSPLVNRNREALKALSGVSFIAPCVEEGKEKALTAKVLALEICHHVNRRRHFGELVTPRALVTYGATHVLIDAVRCVTNLSSGALGAALIRQLYGMGFGVVVLEAGVRQAVERLENISVLDAACYFAMKKHLSEAEAPLISGIFHIAAVSDFVPSKTETGKISSEQKGLTLEFVRSEKLLALENLRGIPFQLGCKLTVGEPAQGLEVARKFLAENKLQSVLWNSAGQLNAAHNAHSGVLLRTTKAGTDSLALHGKDAIAEAMVETFLNFLLGQKV